jgi:hypothetical protein
MIDVAYPGQTETRTSALILGHAATAITPFGANQVVVESARKASRDHVRILLPLASFERTRIAVVSGERTFALQRGIQSVSVDVLYFIGTAGALEPCQSQKRKQ